MPITEPLFNDQFAGAPTKRLLDFLLRKRQSGVRGVGLYCSYAPFELIRAMGAVPITLCAYSNKTIAAAEAVLPSNLCPLIKSSYGFITTQTCPFFELSEAVIAETTCDGKKKMFELISNIKPMHVMDLPQMPDEPEAVESWTRMIRKAQRFLEKTFSCGIDDDAIEERIRETNARNRMMSDFFDYAARVPAVLSWSEMYDVIALANVMSAEELSAMLNPIFATLRSRCDRGEFHGVPGAPRVLVSGCPINGDSAKVFRLIEEAGGTVVALDSCSGMKLFSLRIDEATGDPVTALAKAYLTIPCSCMTPNVRRFQAISVLIERYKPDAVVDVILQACHSYNIESHRIREQVKSRHSLPFLKIETDYSDSDTGRIRLRLEALLEQVSGTGPSGPA